MKKRTFLIEVTISEAGVKEIREEPFDLPAQAPDDRRVKALVELFIEHFASPIKVVSVKEKK